MYHGGVFTCRGLDWRLEIGCWMLDAIMRLVVELSPPSVPLHNKRPSMCSKIKILIPTQHRVRGVRCIIVFV